MKVDLQPADLDALILLAAATKQTRERMLVAGSELYGQLVEAEALALRLVHDAMAVRDAAQAERDEKASQR